jgi:hypothetical protein
LDEQRPGEHAGGRRRKGGWGTRAPVRIVDRHVLAGAEEPGGGQHTDLVLLPAEGGGRTAAEPLREPESRHPGCQIPPGTGLQTRVCGGPAPPLWRAVLPGFLAWPGFINLIPEIKGLRFQVVHSYDVGEAYRLALLHDVHGAFNLAADQVLDAQEVGRVLNTRLVPVPVQLDRAGARPSWQLRLQPVVEAWLDLALSSPLWTRAVPGRSSARCHNGAPRIPYSTCWQGCARGRDSTPQRSSRRPRAGSASERH